MSVHKRIPSLIVLAMIACQPRESAVAVAPPKIDPQVPAQPVLALLEHVHSPREPLTLHVVRSEMEPAERECESWPVPCRKSYSTISELPKHWVDALMKEGHALVADSAFVQEESYYAIIDSAAAVSGDEYVIVLGQATLDGGSSETYRITCGGEQCIVRVVEQGIISDYIVRPRAVRVGQLRRTLFGEWQSQEWN